MNTYISGKTLLTPRERELAKLVAEGLTNRQIAERLSLAERTVKVHLSNAYSKLGISGRKQLTAYARESGLI